MKNEKEEAWCTVVFVMLALLIIGCSSCFVWFQSPYSASNKPLITINDLNQYDGMDASYWSDELCAIEIESGWIHFDPNVYAAIKTTSMSDGQNKIIIDYLKVKRRMEEKQAFAKAPAEKK